MSPPALRRRMAHGNVYKPDKVDAALSKSSVTTSPGRVRSAARPPRFSGDRHPPADSDPAGGPHDADPGSGKEASQAEP